MKLCFFLFFSMVDNCKFVISGTSGLSLFLWFYNVVVVIYTHDHCGCGYFFGWQVCICGN